MEICKASGTERCKVCGIGTYRPYREKEERCDFCSHTREAEVK